MPICHLASQSQLIAQGCSSRAANCHFGGPGGEDSPWIGLVLLKTVLLRFEFEQFADCLSIAELRRST